MDLSEHALVLCSREGKEPTSVSSPTRTSCGSCLHCFQVSRIGHLSSFISRRLGTEHNESDLRMNHSALCSPLALFLISAAVMLFLCCPPGFLNALRYRLVHVCIATESRMCFAEGKLSKNAFKSKNACAHLGFVITAGQLFCINMEVIRSWRTFAQKSLH